jgi:hypothetical protein
MAKNTKKEKRLAPTESARNTDYYTLQSSMKKLQSLLVHPDVRMWMASGSARGVRNRLLKLDFTVLRNVVDRIPLLNAIINTRLDQILPFCHPQREKGERGFEIAPRDWYKRNKGSKPKEKEQNQIAQLTGFFEQTGFNYDDMREDDFNDYVQMIVRDTLVIDQVSTELQRNRAHEVIAFWALDGATIKRVEDPSDFEAGIRFVQEVEGKIYNKYAAEHLLFDYKNKRADLRYRGYGYSYMEQCIDVVTTLLFGYRYVQDQFIRDRVPKGFISVMGDVGQEQLDSIREYWYAAMSGAGGQWSIPVLPSGRDGVGIDFKTIQPNNRDMEYHKLMMFLSSVAGSVFGMDLAEMGIKADDSTSLIGEDSAPRIQSSKDRGLTSVLSFLEQHLNKILVKITDQYVFRFVGLEREDEAAREQILTQQLQSRRTINDLRRDAGDEPLEGEENDIVLNPQSVQVYLNRKNAEQQQQQGGAGEEGQPGMPGGEGGEDEEAPEEGGAQNAAGGGDEEDGEVENWQDMFKALSDRKDREIRIVLK